MEDFEVPVCFEKMNVTVFSLGSFSRLEMNSREPFRLSSCVNVYFVYGRCYFWLDVDGIITDAVFKCVVTMGFCWLTCSSEACEHSLTTICLALYLLSLGFLWRILHPGMVADSGYLTLLRPFLEYNYREFYWNFIETRCLKSSNLSMVFYGSLSLNLSFQQWNFPLLLRGLFGHRLWRIFFSVGICILFVCVLYSGIDLYHIAKII